MKKAILGVIVVGAGAAAMPFVTGHIAESTTKQLIENNNNNYEEYGKVEILSYERGYAETKSSFKWNPPAVYAEFVGPVDYSCVGSHGIISYDYTCKVDKFDQYSDFVETQLGGKDPVKLTGSVPLFGDMTQSLVVDAFTVTPEGESETLAVKSGVLKVSFDKALSFYVLDGHWDGLDVSDTADESKTANVGKVTITGDFKIKEGQKLAFGGATVVLDSFAGKSTTYSGEVENIEMSNLVAFVSAQEKGENMDIDYKIDVDSFSQVKGDDSAVWKDIKTVFAVHGLDTAKTLEINEKMQAYSDEISSGAITPAEGQQKMMLLIPDAEALLKKGLTLKTTLSGDYNQQSASADINLSLIDKATFAEFSTVMFDPAGLLEKLEASVDLVLPETLVEQDFMLQSMVSSSPLFEKKDTAHEAHLQLKKGDVKLNGNATTMDELTALIMGGGAAP